MADEARNRAAFEVQADFCEQMDAPVTAGLCRAIARVLDRSTATGRAVLDWPGEPVADALVLRLVGGLHALYRRGAREVLGRDEALTAMIRDHDEGLLGWLAGLPQTNEAARSGALMTGLLHLAARFGPRMELIEIGASAGINLLMPVFRFALGGVAVGPVGAEVTIEPEWRGPPPPEAAIEIVRTRGVDLHPIDLSDPAAAERLAAYVWVDAAERQARLAAVTAAMRRHGVALDQGDAADWVEARLAEPQAAGTTRVLVHSVVWQYLPPQGRARILAAMAAAGARATRERPLGWVMMEHDRDLHRHEVRVRGWPGDNAFAMVATAHAHGAWIAGLAPPFTDRGEAVRRGSYA